MTRREWAAAALAAFMSLAAAALVFWKNTEVTNAVQDERSSQERKIMDALEKRVLDLERRQRYMHGDPTEVERDEAKR